MSKVVSSTPCPKRQPRDWSENELIRRVLEREPGAWRQLESRYRRLIHRCITGVLSRCSGTEVEEVYAELLISLLRDDMRKLRLWDPAKGTRLGSWLGLLAKNAARDHIRSHISRRPLEAEDLNHLAPAEHSPLDAVLANEWRERVIEALSSYSERDREFLELYFGKRMSVEELAAEMSISVKTVYTKKHKLLARLAAELRAA